LLELLTPCPTSSLLQQVDERGGYSRIRKDLNSVTFVGWLPLKDNLDLCRVHAKLALANDVTQVGWVMGWSGQVMDFIKWVGAGQVIVDLLIK